ncbi:MAG: hypothetical protein PF517_16485 [Salinivirgaceae bacterium]|jgi:hypothetical protein|nr:hypothetical protein [Salinivirgaceae bacterium]
MKDIEKLSLPELKTYRDLLDKRISELRHHQIGDEYYPPYTDKDINEVKEFENQAIKALSAVNKIIRRKLDEFISSIKYN